MSLPPALLKRLASRGLVNSEKKKVEDTKVPKHLTLNEEIIAEDYDEIEDPSQYDYEPMKKPQENFWRERMKRRIVEGNNSGYKGCPNKYNIYHKCTLFCVTRWIDGIVDPNRHYLIRRDRLLKKFPLPKNWTEIYDPGLGVFYYWNKNDETVSWLPPSHPKAIISKSAAALRRELDEIQPPNLDEMESGIAELTEEDIEKILNSPIPSSHKRTERSPPRYERHQQSSPTILKKQKTRDLDKTLRQKAHKLRNVHHRDYHHSSRSRDYRDHHRRGNERNRDGGGNNEDNPLDPMDPASYSEIPRGKWSDGLNAEGGGSTQKTGVDPTVSGTMYQQRPYPSPGAILQANAAADNQHRNRNDENNMKGGGDKKGRRYDNFDEDDYY